MVKSGLEFILKLTEPLQSCCCPVQKYLPRMAELAWQLSKYLWRGSVNFKINSRPRFTIIFKLKNDNSKTQDFSPHIERVLADVSFWQKFTCILSFLFFWTLIGTTWTQEMVWCIMNEFNYAEGKKATLDEKFPYFEWVYSFKIILFFVISKIMSNPETSNV